MDIENILNTVSGSGGSSQGGLMDSVIGLIGGNNNGLNSLVESFTSKGLGNIVSSWVGKGENSPVSGDQISDVIGNEKIAAIAKSLGLDPKMVSSMLSKMLPVVIDKLTPDGKIDVNNKSGFDLSTLENLFKKAE